MATNLPPERRGGAAARAAQKANLYSLISCVDALAAVHTELCKEKERHGWPLTKQLFGQVTSARTAAETVFHDVLARKDKADAARNALAVLTRFKFIFFLSKQIDENMAKGEYSSILNDYARAQSLFKETDVPLFKEVLAELDTKMAKLAGEMRERLVDPDASASVDQHMRVIKYLRLLQPNSEPAWDCITAYHQQLDSQLWQLQKQHHQKVLEALQTGGEPVAAAGVANFVRELLEVLQARLAGFARLAAQRGIAEQLTAKQDLVQQMQANSMNVAAWLVLNALVPSARPDEVRQKYATEFVDWPSASLSTKARRDLLLAALKHLRTAVAALLDASSASSFAARHVRSLVELTTTVRVTALAHVVDATVDEVAALGDAETWRTEQTALTSSSSAQDLGKSANAGGTHTALPELAESAVASSAVPSIQILCAHTGFQGEQTLFEKRNFRETLTNLFASIFSSLKAAEERALGWRHTTTGAETRQTTTTGRVLIAIGNLDHWTDVVIPRLAKAFHSAGVECHAQSVQTARRKLDAFRMELVQCYIRAKCEAIPALLEAAQLERLPEHASVSGWTKELVLYVVLVLAELEPQAPQLVGVCLRAVAANAFRAVFDHFAASPPLSAAASAQCVIDISALEEALGAWVEDAAETRVLLNRLRAELVRQLDQTQLRHALVEFRRSCRMAFDALEQAAVRYVAATRQNVQIGEDDEEEVSAI